MQPIETYLAELEDMDPEELEAALAVLSAYSAPEPPPGAAAALIERLRTYVPAPRRFRSTGLGVSPAQLIRGALLSQVRLFRWPWVAGSAVGALMLPGIARLTGVTPALLAPPLVALGTAYAFRELGSPAMEIELTCPVRPAEVIIIRMLLVLGWISGLGLFPTLFVAGAAAGATLAVWAAGLLFCGGAALLLTLWAGARGGLILVLLGWACWLAWRATLLQSWAHPLGISNTTAAVAGLAMVALALLMPGRLRRLPREEG